MVGDRLSSAGALAVELEIRAAAETVTPRDRNPGDRGRPHGFKLFQSSATSFRGWAMALEGRFTEAIALLESGIEGAKAAGSQFALPLYAAMLATAYHRTGRIEDGHALVTSLLEMLERTGVRYMEAELHRVRAELLMSSGNLDEAEVALERALAIARQQQARIFEMRAATVLARVWRNQGRSAPARALLEPICKWFGDIPLTGLSEAKQVLDQLGH